MTRGFVKTKPSLLEGGLPCASLSAECQRDNNARQRPPQNRLHIWWARRPPTISRAAILAALLPYDLRLDASVLPHIVSEPTQNDLQELPPKFTSHLAFFKRLLEEVEPTSLAPTHSDFIKALGIRGDSDRAYRRMALREEYLIGSKPILLPMDWTYRHPPAFQITPSEPLLQSLNESIRNLLGIDHQDPVVLLDHMAGGGVIPLEGIRYGFKTYANDLNPVASLALKGTLEYPARFGRQLIPKLNKYIEPVDKRVRERLIEYFYIEPPQVWWEHEADRVERELSSRAIEATGTGSV